MEIHIDSLQNIDMAARAFLPLLQNHDVFAFYGGLGAGKTTFIKAVCEQLGVTDSVASPSFAIINEYLVPSTGGSIYHFDFYRIKKITEVYDIGYEDYVYSGNPCFIEWPELIEELLPEDTVRIHIVVDSPDSRTLSIEIPE